MARVTVSFFTVDPSNDEFVMYLVEEGPWTEALLEHRLRAIQDRIYGAVDVAVDGHLYREHPQSNQKDVRIQVDLHGEPPGRVATLVEGLAQFVANSDEYQRAIEASPYIKRLRIVANQL